MVTLAAVAVLSLAACGTGKADGAASSGGADTVAAGLPDGTPTPDNFAAFIEMLATVGGPCVSDAPTEPPVEPTDGSPHTHPPEILPVDASPPNLLRTPGGTNAPARRREAELSAVEQCDGRLHIERIAKELDTLPDPTPEQVRAALNRLGYLDERIHGLEHTGETTRFLLDLRFMGSQLCLSGNVGTSKTVIETFGLFPDEEITDAKRAD